MYSQITYNTIILCEKQILRGPIYSEKKMDNNNTIVVEDYSQHTVSEFLKIMYFLKLIWMTKMNF